MKSSPPASPEAVRTAGPSRAFEVFGPERRPPLERRWVLPLAVLAVASFHLGFLFASLSWLVLVWLGCVFALRRARCGRWAFYTGLAIGLAIYGPQLHFFWSLFGPAVIALWLVLAFWIALFLLLIHGIDRYWGTVWAVPLAPVLWLGIEFFRSELYYLRFAWFTAGSFLPPDRWTWGFANVGVYGLGATLVLLTALLVGFGERWAAGHRPSARMVKRVVLGGVIMACLLAVPLLRSRGRAKAYSGPSFHMRVTGIQLEFPHLSEVMVHLERVIREHPKSDLVMLGEYTFDGPVPQEIRDWCRQNKRHLVAGGKEALPNGQFYNMAFVVSPEGEVVFKQAKAVPIQFFSDGLPAPAQYLWRPGMRATFDPEAPGAPPKYSWLEDEAQQMPARVGLCVCYDLSYALVVQRLIERGGAEVPLLLVPALDAMDWGEHQHRLNARMTAIRAAEHRVWVLRVATSGISQLVAPNGQILAQTGYPGQGEILTGEVGGKYHRNSLPLDRVLGFFAASATALIMVLLGVWRWRFRRRRPAGPPPPNPRFFPPSCCAPSSTSC